MFPTNRHNMDGRIEISPNICHDHPLVAGTRVMAYQVLDLLAAGNTAPKITGEDDFPDLTDENVLACVAFAGQAIREPRHPFLIQTEIAYFGDARCDAGANIQPASLQGSKQSIPYRNLAAKHCIVEAKRGIWRQ